MKILITLLLLISAPSFACQKCCDTYTHLLETLNDFYKIDKECKEFTIEQQEGLKKGIELGMKLSMKIMLSNHHDIKLTVDQWQAIE